MPLPVPASLGIFQSSTMEQQLTPNKNGLKVVCYGFEVSFGRICKVANYRPFRSRAVNHGNSHMSEYFKTVSKLWKQFQNDGTVVRRPGQGRKRMTTASEDRYLALTARRNRKATARQLSSELAAATGAVASRQTIYRRLNEKGLYARKPRVILNVFTSGGSQEYEMIPRTLWNVTVSVVEV
ncbi:transposable element Tcb2 transposase [Trichonephila clavipes]|nr:transposable element Tcb2 transposase [Trichonephila clavipes]